MAALSMSYGHCWWDERGQDHSQVECDRRRKFQRQSSALRSLHDAAAREFRVRQPPLCLLMEGLMAGQMRGHERCRPRFAKSSFSDGGGDCVEVAYCCGLVGIRDSKGPESDVLWFTTAEWQAFLADVRRGSFDTNR
ncbi:DUF397 domain-containing protein [Nocardia gipuzkoensis]